MPIRPEIVAVIEKKMAELKKEDFKRPGRSFLDFLEEYSRKLGQVNKDRRSMEAAKFNFALMDEYAALLMMLVETHAARVARLGAKAEITRIFDDRMEEMKELKETLCYMMIFLLEMSEGDTNLQKKWDYIQKGCGDIDTLDDIVALVYIIRKYPDLSDKAAPAGIEIDDAFLNKAKEQALDMISMHGDAEVASEKSDTLLDRKKRILTLCIDAERMMNLYAKLAFMKNKRHFKAFYTSPSVRKRNKRYRGSKKREIEKNKPSLTIASSPKNTGLLIKNDEEN